MFFWPHKMHTTATKKAPTRRVMLAPGPSIYLYSPECVEGEFCDEIRVYGGLQQVAVFAPYRKCSAWKLMDDV
jgi:hypothetical protein